jgi:hypothetical protein
MFDRYHRLYESDRILIDSGESTRPFWRSHKAPHLSDRMIIERRESPPPLWRATFPFLPLSHELPRVDDGLRLILEDGRTGRATVTEVVQDLELADVWIECLGVEPLTGGSSSPPAPN